MHSSTITPVMHNEITRTLARMPHLARGIGSEVLACSAVAVNIALGRGMTYCAPLCASQAAWGWMCQIQDICPPKIGRDSRQWRLALPLLAGSGRDNERAVADAAVDWMFRHVLPQLMPAAEMAGFYEPWLAMCKARTSDACLSAALAINSEKHPAAYACAYAAFDSVQDLEPRWRALSSAEAAKHASDVVADRQTFWACVGPCNALDALIRAACHGEMQAAQNYSRSSLMVS